jgi:hypothetical protein
MRKFALILGFLGAVSLPAFSQTFTFNFGDLPGGLEIKYERTGKIAGTIKNTSSVPIGCNHLYFGLNYRSRESGDDFRPNLDPGASQDFSWDANATPYIEDCHTGLSTEFKNKSEIKKFQWGTITGIPFNTDVSLSLQNDSDRPIEIDWNESSLIDYDNSSKTIIPAFFRSQYASTSIPNSVVPPRAKLNTRIAPRANYSGPFAMIGITLKPMIPSETIPGLAEKTMKEYAGKKMSLVLQLVIEGKKTPVTFDFEVKSIKAIKPELLPKGMMMY